MMSFVSLASIPVTGEGGRWGVAARVWEEVGAVKKSCSRWGLSFVKEGGATSGGGEIRPMAVVDNFMKIGKGSGSFVTNKLK
jgi:hypothetical protein